MRYKSPIWQLGRWEPPEYIKEEKWYKLEVEGYKLIGSYAVSDHGRVYNYTSESIVSQYFVKDYKIARLRIEAVGKRQKYAYIRQQKFRQLIKQRRLRAGDTLVYPRSEKALNKMKHEGPESVVCGSAKPEVLAARQDEPAAAGDKRVTAFPEPHHQGLPWMKITPEELTVVRMMLASLEDHEAVHVVQAARIGLKRLLDEEERHSAGGLSTDG